MMKKVAELIIRKSVDQDNEVVNALENAGFSLILEFNGMLDNRYIIAKKDKAAKDPVELLPTGNGETSWE